jgi:hypothetical protein
LLDGGYLAREIVRALGGTITPDSTPGAGATFTIRLPLRLENVADSIGRSRCGSLSESPRSL